MQSIEKKISSTLRTIESFFSECFYEVHSLNNSLNKSIAKTIKKDEGFYFEMTKMTLPNLSEREEILYAETFPLDFANHFNSIQFDLRDSKCHFTSGLSGYTLVTGFIKDFTTGYLASYSNSYYRAVIIGESEYRLASYFAHDNSLKIGTTTYGSGVLEISVNGLLLHLFSYYSKETKKSYFIIESQLKCDYKTFYSLLDEIILAISYLTGMFIGKEFYIVGSNSKEFDDNFVLSLKRFFDDLKHGYAAIPDLNIQKQVGVPLERFSIKPLENLIDELLNSSVYKRTLLLICQAHTEPPYVTSTLYSVALETITNLISEEIIEKIRPIQDKQIAKDLKLKLKDVLIDYEKKISKEAFVQINSLIDRYNSPTNKQKLLQPFKHLNISLTEKDIEAIERRNDFLHGRIPKESDKDYLSITNARLLFCINCLILKHVGFEGYIIYQPSVYEINANLNVGDKLIKKI